MLTCRRDSLILHPFDEETVYEGEDGRVVLQSCPECGLTKEVYFSEYGHFLGSVVIQYQPLPSILRNRFEKYQQVRNGSFV